MTYGASIVLGSVIVAMLATLIAVAQVVRGNLGRRALEQLVDLLLASPDAEVNVRKIAERIGREEGARSVSLVPDSAPKPGDCVIVERIDEAGTVVMKFDRAPSPVSRARIKRMLGVLALHSERFRALESARRHHEEARGLEQEAMIHAERTAEFARRQDAVLEVIPDGVAVTDDRGEIVRLNSIGRDIVGVPDVEPTERSSLEDATNPLLQALREGTTLSGLEVAIASPTGPRIIQVKVSKLSEDPESRSAVALFRDVTHELLLEHDLRRKGHELEQHVTALERATRLKSDFLANMSHELRTPLNAVIGFTEVLLDGTYGSLNERQAQCAGDVVAAGRHLLALINDILDLSKIEAGRMELALEDVDLADLVAQALTFVRPQADAKEIRLCPEIERGRFVLRGDPDRLRQILVNLLSNAVKFTPRAGKVSVTARNEGDKARVSVTDTGMGIPEAERGKLFKEFSQLDGSVTRKHGGTGLGLAICKRLVELHGGAIDFTSAVGQGSTFWFDVPQAARGTAPTFAPTHKIVRRKSSHHRLELFAKYAAVLVLDQDPAARKLVESVLADAGIGALSAGSLAEARALAAAPEFEVAVVDPMLNGVTPADVNAWARERFGPCVVVSSLATRLEAMAGLRVGGFVEKPIDPVSLVEAVRAARERKGAPRGALVVDPHEDDARAVTSILEQEGFAVTVVPTLAEARKAVNGARLVIVELELPDGDGTTLLRELAGHDQALVVLTERELDTKAMTTLEKLCSLVLRKGSLSRSAFARHITALCDPGGPRTRVLAVDDNEQNLRLITAVLAGGGYDILEARDAASALRIARAERPDVILMDIMLPDVDGLSATRELKKSALTQAIPVIAVTAQAMAGDADRAREAGCTDYVPKPINSQNLLRAIERAIGHAP